MKPHAREQDKNTERLEASALATRRRTRSISGRISGKKKTRSGGYLDEPPTTPTVVIVDEDLGFVWWLGEILIKAGCTVVPALNCQDAISLSKRLNLKVDLIFVNPALKGISEMTKQLGPIRKFLTFINGNETAEWLSSFDIDDT